MYDYIIFIILRSHIMLKVVPSDGQTNSIQWLRLDLTNLHIPKSFIFIFKTYLLDSYLSTDYINFGSYIINKTSVTFFLNNLNGQNLPQIYTLVSIDSN